MSILIHFFARGRLHIHYRLWFTALFNVAVIYSAQLLSAQELPAPGSVDWTFEHKVNGGHPISILVQPDGRLLVGGGVYIPGPRSGVSRLNCDGSYDPTFALASNSVLPEFSAMALQPDGKVLVSSHYSAYGELRRFNPDGSLDSSFLGLELPSDPCEHHFWANALAFQPDGKLLGSGYRWQECYYDDDGSWSSTPLYRWLPNSDLDDSFTPYDPGYGDGVLAFVVLTNNQILVAGNDLTLLHPNGTKDTNFVAGPFLPGRDTYAPAARIHCCAIQPDGRILIGGLFTNVQGQARYHIARLLPDGHLDLSFNPPTITGQHVNWSFHPPLITGLVLAIAIQTDGRILIGGDFDTIDGLLYGDLARLNSDGSLDTTFLPWPDMDDGVCALVIQDETRALVGGGFGDDYPTGDLFRIHLGEPAPRLSLQKAPGDTLQMNFTYFGSNHFNLLTATNFALPPSNWSVLGSATNRGAYQYEFIDRIVPQESQRFYRLQWLETR